MPIKFREDRATQAAARLLKLRGGQMSYLKLLKMMYLADREALRSLGRPITYDRYCSMKEGPVLSKTYDLIRYETPPGEEVSYWRQHISSPRDYSVQLLHDDPPSDQLSAAEEAILAGVFAVWGHRSRWEIRDFTHTLPEYTETEGSIPIRIRDVLIKQGVASEDADAIVQEIWAADQAKQLLG